MSSHRGSKLLLKYWPVGGDISGHGGCRGEPALTPNSQHSGGPRAIIQRSLNLFTLCFYSQEASPNPKSQHGKTCFSIRLALGELTLLSVRAVRRLFVFVFALGQSDVDFIVGFLTKMKNKAQFIVVLLVFPVQFFILCVCVLFIMCIVALFSVVWHLSECFF